MEIWKVIMRQLCDECKKRFFCEMYMAFCSCYWDIEVKK